PALSMLSPENVATPLTAAWVSVPASVPLLGFVPIATVMSPVNPVAVLPPASWAVTSTAGVIAAPAVVVLGCTENTSCVAVPAVMLNEIGSAPRTEVAVRVEPVPALSMLSPEKLATPLTAAWVSVPASVPVLGFVPIATVMFPVNPLAVLPPASWAVTSTAGVIAVPAAVVLGCTLNTDCVAVPAVILNAVLVVLPAPVAVRV